MVQASGLGNFAGSVERAMGKIKGSIDSGSVFGSVTRVFGLALSLRDPICFYGVAECQGV